MGNGPGRKGALGNIGVDSVFAYVSVGSNIEDRESHIRKAMRLIGADSMTREIVHSNWIWTEPMGMPEGTEPFLNGVVKVHTDADVSYFFDLLCRVERELGRTSKGDYQSRPIDLDLIFWGDLVLQTPFLRIPHPRYRQRSFVLEPLIELAPEIVDPETGVPIGDYLKLIHLQKPFSLADLPIVAGQLADYLVTETRTRAIVVGLSGEMGAGKTTLVRAIVAYLQSEPEATSPTFDLIHVHLGPRCTVVHSDLYRLDSEEVDALDLDYYLNSAGVLMIIEWPERSASLHPDLHVTVTALDNGDRRIGIMFENGDFWEPAKMDSI